jgi:hypothetical protein
MSTLDRVVAAANAVLLLHVVDATGSFCSGSLDLARLAPVPCPPCVRRYLRSRRTEPKDETGRMSGPGRVEESVPRGFPATRSGRTTRGHIRQPAMEISDRPERQLPNPGLAGILEAWVFGRNEMTAEPWQAGFAVRRDWRQDGSHEFIGFQLTEAAAGWFAVGDRAYWRRCHVRPTHSVVPISIHDFELHVSRRECRSPDCPVAPTVPMDASSRVVAQ